MARVLALDVGEKTIGVAVSDENQMLAFPVKTIRRQEGKKRDMAALRELVAEYTPEAIIVGLPLMMDGSQGVQAEKVGNFIAALRNNVRIPIIQQDERLTTSEAERVLIEGGRSRVERKKNIDALAACLILQAYLDRQRNDTNRTET